MSESLRDLVVSLSLNSDNFTRNIRSVNAQIKEAESYFKLAGAGVTKFESTTAGLSSKLSMLQQKHSLQTKAVDQYQKSLTAANAQLQKSTGENGRLKEKLDAARKSYEDLGHQVDWAQRVYDTWNSTLGEGHTKTQEAKAKLDALKQEYTQTGEQIKLMEGQLVSSNKQIQNNADKVSKAQTALNGAQSELRETESALQRCALELRTSESLWTKAGAAMTKFGQSAKSIGKASSAVGKELNRYVTAPIVALGTYATKASIDMEDAFAGVRKTVKMTEDEYAKLDQSIKNMSTVKPANYETIAFVAETAGQLGVAKQAVEGFTSVMTDLGSVSNDLNAEEAATSLAKMANIMGVVEEKQTTEYFQRMGSTVLELGVNSATTEANIVQMAMRLAAAGRQVGMTEAEILGVSTALSSVGIESQMGGTAFSKALIRMELACEEGGDALKDFAKVAGMSATDFKNLFKSDATAGMQAFIAGLARLGDEGISTIGTLQDIGFKEVRLRDTTLRMVNANELLTRSVQTAKQAWSDNTAINDLVAERYNTTAKRLEMLKNKARLAASTFSGIMLPTMEDLMKTASGWLDKLTQMDEGQRKQIVSIGLWAAAAGPLLSTFGKISSTVGSVSISLGKFSTKVGEAGGGLKGLVSVVGKSKLAMVGLVAAAGAGAYMLYDWASGAKACREALEGMNATAEKWKQTQASTIYNNGGLESFGLSKEQFAATGRTTKQWLSDMIATWSDGRNETDEIVSSYTDSFAALTANTKSALDKLRQTAQEAGHVDIASGIQKDMDKLDSVNAQIAKLLKKKQNKKLTEQDKIKLQELIDTKESIEVKYKLTPEQVGGYGQILQDIETEVARAQARGQKGADPKVYAQGLTATAEGYAAIREQIDQRYASEYALIQLMEDGAEKDEARTKLDADYNEQRKSAAEDYANALKQMLGPVWDQPGIQKAGEDMDSLMQLFREYSTLGSTGYKDPAILEKMNQLFEGMDKDELLSYLGVLQQVQSLLDGGMSEEDVKKLFPEVDFSGELDQFAALAKFAKENSSTLQGLSDTLNGLVPDEMKKLAIDLDMTAAETRWAEFASNPGAITTDAIINSYSKGSEAAVPQPIIDVLVKSYQEIEGGASTARLTPDDVVAQVISYMEGEGCSIAALSPDQIEAIVSSYSEATGCDKSALLAAFTAKIAAYDDTNATKPKTLLTTKIAITGYDLAALQAFKENNPVTVTGIVQLREQFDNPQDVLDDPNAKFYMNGQQISVDVVPRDRITADTLFVYDSDGSMHVLITPEIKGTAESTDTAGAQLDKPTTFTNVLGETDASTTVENLKNINAELNYLKGSLGTWQQFWGLMDGKSKEGMANSLAENLGPEELANLQAFVQEATKAIENKEKLSDDAIAKLQEIQTLTELLDAIGIGENITAGIGAAMSQAGWSGDAESVAGNLEAALNAAFQINSPSKRVQPVGQGVAEGVALGMTQTSMTASAQTLGNSVTNNLRIAMAMSKFTPIGKNAMAGLAIGILSGRASVVSAIQTVAAAAVQAAKDKLKVQSPSVVFRDEVGRMMTKGMAQGALLESKNQAKIIANASRYLTSAAKEGVYSGITSDNRRNYTTNNAATVNVERLVVNDKQDVRALAQEIGIVQRRAAIGMGG
ncbi:phage tail tape measure protein [Eubacteriales bacterium OttesenSCG-928-N13]|nr:phage tail tape measure protein [Eubacteriales bacterium OttesenSCG-928-N13]